MFDPNQIKHTQIEMHARHPPFESQLFHPVPVEEWISPTLSGLAEIVGWHSTDQCWFSFFIQKEKGLVAPDIGTVVGNIKWYVTKGGNPFLVRIILESEPLSKEKKLQETTVFYLLSLIHI